MPKSTWVNEERDACVLEEEFKVSACIVQVPDKGGEEDANKDDDQEQVAE